MIRETLLISLMILPVGRAMAVPKVVGNGFSEKTTIGQSTDTLGAIRDKANAAMPKTGGTFTGGIGAQFGNFSYSLSAESVTAKEFDADGDTLLLNTGDLVPAAKFSLKNISLYGDNVSLYYGTAPSNTPWAVFDSTDSSLSITNLHSNSLYSDGDLLFYTGNELIIPTVTMGKDFSINVENFNLKSDGNAVFNYYPASGFYLDANAIFGKKITAVGPAKFLAVPAFSAGIPYQTGLTDAGTDQGTIKSKFDAADTALSNETDRAKTAEGLLMPKSGGEFGGSVTAASLTSRNGLGLDKGDVRIGTSGNLLFTTSANAVAAYFSSDASGDLLINTGIGGGGGIRPVAYTFDALTKSPTKGSIHICSDCMINGHKFIAVMWNGSAWTGLSGEEVTH